MAGTDWMDFEGVQQVSRDFSTVAQSMQKIGKVLEAALHVLESTAFIGLVGGAAVINYLHHILPIIERIVAIMEEQSADLNKSAMIWRDSQEQMGGLF